MKNIMKLSMIALMIISAGTIVAQPPKATGPQRTPEENAKRQTEMMAGQLGLNDAQQKSIYDLNFKRAKESAERRAAAPDRATMTDEQKAQMREEGKKRNEEYQTELKKILTPEQYAKWQQIQEERQKQAAERRASGPKPVATAPAGGTQKQAAPASASGPQKQAAPAPASGTQKQTAPAPASQPNPAP